MLIDAHCHFNSLPESKQKELISSAGRNCCFIDSGIDLASSQLALELSRRHSFIYTSLGFHPFSADSFSPEVLARYEKLIDENKKVVAIGEVGLDFKAGCPLQEQEDILGNFVTLAQKKNLALLVHTRLEASGKPGGIFRILQVLDKFLSGYETVIFHCFSYSRDFLRAIIERNAFVSFSLNILRKKENVLTALKECPLGNLLLETDSPYMKIGKSDSLPSDIGKVYAFAASVRGIAAEELEREVFNNAKKVFSLPR